jgi:hypothetical protein
VEVDDELIPTERVGLVVWRLWHRRSLTTVEIAELAGVTRAGAWTMMDKLSRKLPIVLVDGVWRVVEGE